MGRTRRFGVLLSVLVVSSVISGRYGSLWSPAQAAGLPSDDEIRTSLKTFTRVFDVVEANAAEKVNPDTAIYKGAITGMLRTLDPHSNFYDPRETQIMREGQRGAYFGVGMYITYRNNRVIVQYPFEGSPAKRAGLRPADVIVAVNGKNTEKMNTNEVVDLLKGPRGTPANISVRRDGVKDPITYQVLRDEVYRPSVSNGMWLKPGIGFVQIEQFNENTSKELNDALVSLGEDHIEGLILDLRGNPGGILQEAVAVSERWLDRGQTIVSQRGRISAERPYVARRGASHNRRYPIVVLVNRYSASAAEIVAGALQDHDRAWILGENTFGKGLVQAPYPLSGNSQLLLTIARFYTPSGRLIQRDYSKGSFFEYYYRKDTATRNDHDVKATDSGRVVYGGGGISPDEKFTLPTLNRFQIAVLSRASFFDYSAHYFGPREAKLPKGWAPDESTVADFKKFLQGRETTFTDAEFDANKDWIKRSLRQEMYITAFNKEESDHIAIPEDEVVLKAIDSMPKSKALLEKARSIVAGRRQ